MENKFRGTRNAPLNQDPKAVCWALAATRMSQEQLRARTGISASLISEILSGKRNATPQKLGLIADALNCPVSVLEAKKEWAA